MRIFTTAAKHVKIPLIFRTLKRTVKYFRRKDKKHLKARKHKQPLIPNLLIEDVPLFKGSCPEVPSGLCSAKAELIKYEGSQQSSASRLGWASSYTGGRLFYVSAKRYIIHCIKNHFSILPFLYKKTLHFITALDTLRSIYL